MYLLHQYFYFSPNQLQGGVSTGCRSFYLDRSVVSRRSRTLGFNLGQTDRRSSIRSESDGRYGSRTAAAVPGHADQHQAVGPGAGGVGDRDGVADGIGAFAS